MSDDKDFEAQLNALKKRVSQFNGTGGNTGGLSFSGMTGGNVRNWLVSNQRILLYVGIPAGLMFVLAIWKPNFVTEEVSTEGELPQKRFSFRKALIATLVITLGLLGGIGLFNMYKKKSMPLTASPLTAV